MAFFNAFLNFISWILLIDAFRMCIAVICCLAGWFTFSEIVRYMCKSYGDDDK